MDLFRHLDVKYNLMVDLVRNAFVNNQHKPADAVIASLLTANLHLAVLRALVSLAEIRPYFRPDGTAVTSKGSVAALHYSDYTTLQIRFILRQSKTV